MALNNVLRITFNEDIALASTLSINKMTGGLPDPSDQWTWVVNRTLAFEVTQGTPTANLGEADAEQFVIAFNLDLNSTGNYIVTREVNVVTIKSVADITFVGNSSSADITFEILSEPFERINARSPYLITAPIYDGSTTINPESVDFELYVWSGDITTDKPVTPSYTYTKQPRFTGDQIIYLDVSQQIRDFIQHNYSGSLTQTTVFVAADVTTTYNSGADTLVQSNLYLAFDGYNDYFDGVNFKPTDDLLITNRYISRNGTEQINLPFFLGGDEYFVEFRDGTDVLGDDDVTPINIINTNNVVKNVVVLDTGVNNIRVENVTQATEFIIDVEEVEECIYEPIKCVFVNKFGVLQEFWFFKANREDLTVKDEQYKANVLTESIVGNIATLSYSTSRHNTQRYNAQGNKNITLNTGYIDEDNNALIEQLFLSEDIWLDIDGVTKPVNIVDKSTQLQTKRNDQLIKYTIRFAFSFDEINNVR